jgi:hypothetical protein
MADSHINGSKGKGIPELTRQSEFGGNSYLIVFARLQSPVLSDNATTGLLGPVPHSADFSLAQITAPA